MSGISRQSISSKLSYSVAERPSVGKEGAEPPLRIVPTKTNREEGEVRPTVKIKYLSGDSQLLPIYDGTDRNAEALLKHILLFKVAAKKTGIIPEHKLCMAFKDRVKAELEALGPPPKEGDSAESNITRKIDVVDVTKSQREWCVYDIQSAIKKLEVLTERYYSLWDKSFWLLIFTPIGMQLSMRSVRQRDILSKVAQK